jgi:hypothetical protein
VPGALNFGSNFLYSKVFSKCFAIFRIVLIVHNSKVEQQFCPNGVIYNVLTEGHIPGGMELFSAGDESQLE